MSKPNPYEPAEEDIDLPIEVYVTHPEKGRLKATIAGISRRIIHLEYERAQFVKITAQGHKVPTFLKVNTRDLKRARELLARYRAQLGNGN